MKPGEAEVIEENLAGLVGCTIVAIDGDGYDSLTLHLSDGTDLYLADPTGDQGLCLSRGATPSIVSTHRTETGCNLTREDWDRKPSFQCKDGGWGREHPTYREADLIEALEYHAIDGITDATEVAEIMRIGTHDRSDGSYDDWAYAAVVRLTNGKFAALSGGYDYTGWSCQAGLEGTIHDSEEQAWLNLGTDDRAMIERAEADR
jgi:hypothetical protein